MRFIIVSATQKDNIDFFANTPLGKSLSKLINDKEHNLYFEIFYNNTRGLSEVYNEAIEKYKNKLYDYDIMVFIHSDVYINDCFFMDKLAEASKENDVIGVAGSSFFSIKNLPNTWHNSPREYWSGFVVHPREDKNESQLFCTNFGDSPKKVICLDGLMIACKTTIFNNDKIRFDNDFTFHFYDLSFSLICYINGLKLTTWPICLTHLSHGKGIISEEYKLLNQKFIEKWAKKT